MLDDLTVREITLLAKSMELHAEALDQNEDMSLVLELSRIHVKLLLAAKEILVRERDESYARAREQEFADG